MNRTALTLTAAAAAAAAGMATAVLPAQAATPVTPPIVFTSDHDGDMEIYRRAANGTVTQLTRNRAHDYGAVWSPDGRRLAFVSSRDGDADVFVMNADGTGVRQLTVNSRTAGGAPIQDSAPTWSRDGGRIAFASTRDGGEPEIYVMNADGTSQRRVTRTAAYVSDHTPEFSPDGRWILFASDRAGYDNYEIYRVRTDGTGLVRVTRTAAGIDDNAPRYSPDGRTIAFTSTRRGTQDIFLMNADGSWVRGLTGSPTLDDVFPQWTADGTQVVFWTFSGPGGSPSEDVWIVDSDRTDRRRLLGSAAGESLPDPQPPVR